MVGTFLAALAAFIIAVISGGGYVGVLALMAIESACIPLPSEIILPFSGYLVSIGRFSLIGVATAGAIGCNLGSTIAYFAIGRAGEGLVRRWGSLLLISPHELDATKRFFDRFGAVAVFVGRLLPVVRTFIAVPAGLAGMPQAKFQLYTFVGSWLWCYALAYVGMRLGARWDADPEFRAWFHRFDAAILAAIVAAIGFFLWSRMRTKKAPTR